MTRNVTYFMLALIKCDKEGSISVHDVFLLLQVRPNLCEIPLLEDSSRCPSLCENEFRYVQICDIQVWEKVSSRYLPIYVRFLFWKTACSRCPGLCENEFQVCPNV